MQKYTIKSWIEYGALNGFSVSYFKQLLRVYDLELVAMVESEQFLKKRIDYQVSGTEKDLKGFYNAILSMMR